MIFILCEIHPSSKATHASPCTTEVFFQGIHVLMGKVCFIICLSESLHKWRKLIPERKAKIPTSFDGSYKNINGNTDLYKFILYPLTSKKKKGSSLKLNGKPKQGMSECSVWWRQLQALSLHGIGHQPCDSSRESRDICPILRYSIFSITLMSVTFLDQS